MEMSLLTELIILFLLSIAVNLVCNKFKLPAIVGFLLTGVLCGPSMLSVVPDMKAIDEAADIGVVLLMFTIGMELSGEALNRLKRPVFLGGSLQIGLIVAACCLLGLFHGKPATGVMWGCLIALSSSAIVLQLFQQKGISSTPVGRLSLAILVFQDIMAAPMMIIIPLISGSLEITASAILFAILKVASLGLIMFIFSRYILDRLMNAVVKIRAREILLLTTLCIGLGFATLTKFLGMSTSLGAFLAGLMLARSQYSMSVISIILPYRDVFISLFFITVGMLLDINFVIQHIGTIALIVGCFIVFKTLLSLPAVLTQGYPLGTAIRTSLCLAQVGEFSFVLAATAMSVGLLDKTNYQMFLAISVVTMMLTSTVISAAPKVASFICGTMRKFKFNVQDGTDSSEQEQNLSEHIIIIGYGFSGQQVARAAKECNLPYTILEMNPDTVNRFKEQEPIAYGDANQPTVLSHLGIEKAKVLAIVISDPAAVRSIVPQARKMNPDVSIIARTRFVTEIGPLHELGANYVIAEEFESTVEVFSQVLSAYFVPRQDIEQMADYLRGSRYKMVRRFTHDSQEFQGILKYIPDMGLQSIRLENSSPLCGKSLLEIRLRNRFEVTVVAIYRNKTTFASPKADFVLQADDILCLFGKSKKLYECKNAINPPQQA